MAAKLVTLVDAVVTSLTGGSFTTSFTPVKTLAAVTKLADVDTLKVEVIGGGQSWTKQDRAASYLKDYAVLIRILAPIAADDAATVETYLELAEEIKEHLAGVKLAGLHCVEVEESEPFDLDKIIDDGQFVHLSTFTYRGF